MLCSVCIGLCVIPVLFWIMCCVCSGLCIFCISGCGRVFVVFCYAMRHVFQGIFVVLSLSLSFSLPFRIACIFPPSVSCVLYALKLFPFSVPVSISHVMHRNIFSYIRCGGHGRRGSPSTQIKTTTKRIAIFWCKRRAHHTVWKDGIEGWGMWEMIPPIGYLANLLPPPLLLEL